MPLFTFTITYRNDSRYPVHLDLPDRQAAFAEAVIACGEAIEGLDGSFGEDDDWLLTVANESGQSIFELRCTSRNLMPEAGVADAAGYE